jgi:alpha-tubulin suppressor-like RCC1 family protein
MAVPGLRPVRALAACVPLILLACESTPIGTAAAPDAAADTGSPGRDGGATRDSASGRDGPALADVAPADLAPASGTDTSVDAVEPTDALEPDAGVRDTLLPDLPPPGPSPATAVFAGLSNTCAIFANGYLKCWGSNESGQLGQGDRAPRGHQPGSMGAALHPVELGAGRTVRSVAIGAVHTCALLDNGGVKCWGDNTNGQLGTGMLGFNTGDEPGEMGDQLAYVDLGTGRLAVAISAGPSHTCAVLDDRTIKCWGHDIRGCLGQELLADRGPGNLGDRLKPVELGTGLTARSVAAGGVHNSVLGHDDAFRNSAYSCALLNSGQVKCWGGANMYEQLGAPGRERGARPGDMGDNLPAVNLGGRLAAAVTFGGGHGCALVDTGAVKCWGVYHQSQLGADNQPYDPGDPLPSVKLGRPARAVSASGTTTFLDDAHTCALLDDGSVKCWGLNGYGQLGQGDDVTRGDLSLPNNMKPVDLGTNHHAVAVAAGGYHTCAVLEDGTVKCWGAGAGGKLGYEDTMNRGVAPGDMGDRLPAVRLW